MNVLLDTSVVVDHLRGHAPALRFVAALERPPLLAAVTVTELMAGARSRRDEAVVAGLVAASRVVPIDLDIADRAGRHLRHFAPSHGLDAIDALIAAAAEAQGAALATVNVKHFPMFRHLKRAY